MPSSHIVQQGEHLAAIAAQYGFQDYTVVWNHPDNASLKQLRKNPNVLLPGDTLTVPDKQAGTESAATAQRHTFKLAAMPLTLRFVLEDVFDKPVANTPCSLQGDGTAAQITSNGAGAIQQRIPVTTGALTLTVASDTTPSGNQPIAVDVGALDPVDALSGQAGRLNNLGYGAGTPQDATNPQFQSALQEFQCDSSLLVDGVAGPKTQAKLREIHGC